ncbi:tyrosine-type recombinase/integrase [Zhongshania guokunii]|uniref:Tyrosine-type recombinase/integrase n=1 Tax=Zhongshania guokunii TaxID=641783 RepID=A0ABV3U5F1_9GAMM
MPKLITQPAHPSTADMGKIRIVDGHALPPNLYQNQRKEPGKWRYKRPDGSYYAFAASISEAIEAAKGLNAQFAAGSNVTPAANPQYGRLSIRRHAEDFISEREKREPTLASKTSWDNRKAYLRSFAALNAGKSVSQLTLLDIQQWWDKLTGNAQRSRRAEFRRFFNHLIARNLCPKMDANPFSSSDAVPRVEMSARPAKMRLRLTLENYWHIYNKAGELGYEFVQIAMGIALVTTLRRGDICDLTWDNNITGTLLRKQINKSHAQLSGNYEFTGGKAAPANLCWNMDQHQLLRKLINRARELAMKNGRCTHVISHKLEKRYKRKKVEREHHYQILPDYLTRAFAEARDATEIYNGIPTAARPGLHEVRALSSDLYRKAGYTTGEIQQLMAHTDEKITEGYLAGHETQWTDIAIAMPDQVIGGAF